MTYLIDGFDVIESVLTERDVSLARKLVTELIVRFRARDTTVVAASESLAAATSRHPIRNPGVTANDWESEPYIIGDLVSLDARFATLFAQRKLWCVVAKCLDCSIEEVVFHFSNVTRKPAFVGPQVAAHRDAQNKYFASVDERTIRVLLPMQTMNERNGGTTVFGGSHGTAAPCLDSERCPEVVPGSCLVLHSRVLHAGASNRSEIDRDVIVVQFGVVTSELKYQTNECLALCGLEDFVKFCSTSPQANFELDTENFQGLAF